MICELYPDNNYMTVHSVGNDDVLYVEVFEIDGNVCLRVYAVKDGVKVFTFNELAIIQDNWNAMQELRKNRLAEGIIIPPLSPYKKLLP